MTKALETLSGTDLVAFRSSLAGYGFSPLPNKRVILVGDSFFYRHTYNGVNQVVWEPVNTTGNRYICHGELNHVRYRLRQAFEYDGTCNYGIVGQTNPQISARLASILASDAAATVIRIASVNQTSDAVYYQETMDALAADYATCQAQGRYVIFLTPSTAGDANFTSQRGSATKVKALRRVRRDMLALYSNRVGCDVIDMDVGYADYTSTLGDNIVGMASEGLHPSTVGAYTRSLRYDAIFSKRFPPVRYAGCSNSDLYDATNNPAGARNLNPALDGTAGSAGTGGTGSVATNYTGGNGNDTGHTRVYSKVTGPNTGRPAQRIVLGGTMGGTTADISLLLQNITGMPVGGVFQLSIEMDGWTGLTGVSSITTKILNTDTFAIQGADHDYSGLVGFAPSTVRDGMFMTPPVKIDGSNLRISLQARALGGTTIGGTIDVLNISLNQVG